MYKDESNNNNTIWTAKYKVSQQTQDKYALPLPPNFVDVSVAFVVLKVGPGRPTRIQQAALQADIPGPAFSYLSFQFAS